MSVDREYKTRIGDREYRTSNAELRTPNESAPTVPGLEAQDNAVIQDDILLSPPNGERNEVRGLDGVQAANSDAITQPNLNITSSPRPSLPLHGGERDGVAATSSEEHRTFNIERPTSNEDAKSESPLVGTSRGDVTARVPADGIESESASAEFTTSFESKSDGKHRTTNAELRTPNPGSAASPSARTSAASSESRQRDAGAPREPDRNHVTRQELQRELDSLRRLIESRK